MARVHVSESISMAMSSLWANKLRTFLTLLGIIIGVLTIISVVSIIQGLNTYVYTKMAFYGANDFTVTKFSMFGVSLEEFREQMKRKDLTMEDMRTIKDRCTECELIGATASNNRMVKFGSQFIRNVEVRGVTHMDHMIGTVVELERGRHILKEDEDHSRAVCIIGRDVVNELFPTLDPLGRRIKIGSQPFLVVGIGKEKGKLLGMSQDNYVRIPISTFLKIYGSRRSIDINIHTASQEQMMRAQQEVRTILRSKRHLAYGESDDFAFRTSDTFIDLYKSATQGIYFAMIAISAISLLVGGIVIMNIMLVAVTERTKEIGIRKAIGARRQDILMQFLIEAAALSTTGGIFGVLSGFLIAKAVSAATSLPSTLDPTSVVVAILVSGSVGLFFGLYPASKASKLDPIEALRSEQ
ncbi:MAG: ABC transporter permease [Acidobacteria bacterium]|nr:ABC transporter permease [Acidobacteriota bacterium]MBU4329665.1 ABC transporter permease [Acidobacteriota bacterium]MCG2814585.1 ABC transporter permease [Candidatus Aminicenantes bacterium]